MIQSYERHMPLIVVYLKNNFLHRSLNVSIELFSHILSSFLMPERNWLSPKWLQVDDEDHTEIRIQSSSRLKVWNWFYELNKFWHKFFDFCFENCEHMFVYMVPSISISKGRIECS